MAVPGLSQTVGFGKRRSSGRARFAESQHFCKSIAQSADARFVVTLPPDAVGKTRFFYHKVVAALFVPRLIAGVVAPCRTVEPEVSVTVNRYRVLVRVAPGVFLAERVGSRKQAVHIENRRRDYSAPQALRHQTVNLLPEHDVEASPVRPAIWGARRPTAPSKT